MNARQNMQMDELIRDSLSEDIQAELNPAINQQILRKIEKHHIWRIIFSDFVIKVFILLLLLIVPPALSLGLELMTVPQLLAFIDTNVFILSGGLLFLISILFINELTDKILSFKLLKKDKDNIAVHDQVMP